MTDLEALAEQMTAEQYKRWGLEEPHDDLRGPTWDKVRRAKENALKDLTDLGYSIAGPDEMITPKKSITPIEEAFKDFDIAGPDEVVVPREPEETLIQAMYDALHATTRTSNPTAWKAGLEAVFDVDGFLKYLAANQVIQNWDTYGVMTHNYYLYNDPAMGKLRWIVWDNNEALSDNRRSLPLALNTTGTDWPLINYLINNSDYETTYKGYVKSIASSSFATSRMGPIYSAQQSLLSTSAGNEENGYTHRCRPKKNK